MWKYVLKRILGLIFIMLGTAFVIFTIMYFVPGDPADAVLGTSATAAEKLAYRERMGLNDPYLVQLGRYFYDTFIRFDLGTSYSLKVSVAEELMRRIPRTLLLGVISIVIDIFIGIPIGILAARRQDTWVDRAVMAGSMVLISLPNFWVALMMVVLFAVKLNWLPAYGIGTPAHWVMPILAEGLSGIATNARMTRSSVLETIRADFVTTARAKGLPEQKVIYKHMMPNALIPIVNLIGGRLGVCIAGTVVIESVFSFPGVGMFMLTGINNRDYPVVRSSVLILALFSAICILLADLAYAYIDPRIKAQYVSAGSSKRTRKDK